VYMTRRILWITARTLGLLGSAWLVTTSGAAKADADCWSGCNVSCHQEGGGVYCTATCTPGTPGMTSCTGSSGGSTRCSMCGRATWDHTVPGGPDTHSRPLLVVLSPDQVEEGR